MGHPSGNGLAEQPVSKISLCQRLWGFVRRIAAAETGRVRQNVAAGRIPGLVKLSV
jgi:hypothetical protein